MITKPFVYFMEDTLHANHYTEFTQNDVAVARPKLDPRIARESGMKSTPSRWPPVTLGWNHIHSWWISTMMTSSNGNIFRVTGPLCREFTGPGEFPAQRPVTRSFDVFFDLRPNKRLSKQPWGWWFETLSWSLWRHCNDWNKYLPTQSISHNYSHSFDVVI